MQLVESEAAEHHAWLRERFTETLLAQNPVSVLDVGAGSGELLRALGARGVEACGLDRASPRLEQLEREGLCVLAGSAEELPFERDAFDWVTLRHVPHHLARPEVGLAEAVRVARRGVLLAEPSFDDSLPSQRAARLLDVWEKRQHRRRGRIHAEVFDLPGLLDLLPEFAGAKSRLEVHSHLRLRARSIDTFREEALALVQDLPGAHRERDDLADLLEHLERCGLSWNGSLILAVHLAGEFRP